MSNSSVPLTAEQLASITPHMIDRVYSGKWGCMCGCNGKYYTSGKMIARVLQILKADPRVRLQDGYILHIDDDLAHKGNERGQRAERLYVVYLKKGVRV